MRHANARHPAAAAPFLPPGRTFARRKFFSDGALTLIERLEDAIRHRPDGSGAERDDEIVRACDPFHGSRNIAERLHQSYGFARLANLRFDSFRGRAGARRLAGRIAVGQTAPARSSQRCTALTNKT